MEHTELPADVAACIPPAFNLAIAPGSPLYEQVAPLCKQANPLSCLVGTTGYVLSGHRMSLRFEHEDDSGGTSDGLLTISLGDGWSARKRLPATAPLVRVGSKFDRGVKIKAAASEHVNLRDGTWEFRYRHPSKHKQNKVNGRPRARSGNDAIKHVRDRTLRQVRNELAAAG